MIASATATRTLVLLGSSVAALVTAALLAPRRPPPAPATGPSVDVAADDGVVVAARAGSTAILAGDHDEPIAVTIRVPTGARAARPPLDLAVVIDRSGSMAGRAIDDAREAASRLIGQLGPDDAFTVVTYSSGDEVIAPFAAATPGAKDRARAAIARIDAEGATCISCGLTRAAAQLGPRVDGRRLARVVLISDGQANEGLYDRGELTALAADVASHGASISTVGVGLDFDEVTMTQLATVGRGRYHFVEATAALDAMFDRELRELGATIAVDAALTITPLPGVELLDAYGYPAARVGGALVVPIADLRAGEARKVVVRAHVRAGVAAGRALLGASLSWRRVGDGAPRQAYDRLDVDVVADPGAIARGVDRDATRAIEQALSAQALDAASQAYARGAYDAAREVIERRGAAVRARAAMPGIGASLGDLEVVQAEAQAVFAAPPASAGEGARVMKSQREKAYQLSR
jgi:Ca-activated chloride channel family protein